MAFARYTAAALAGMVLAGCATAVYDPAPVSLPDSAPDSPCWTRPTEPEVRTDPRSRYGNRPYELFGKRYEVLESAVGYDETGLASWYGLKFHGRPTSSGEIYDLCKLTAAHTTLPIPSYARVTNESNGRTTIVRINDRGPFHAGRIIDLSYATAQELGFADAGTASVRVQTVLPGDVDVGAGQSGFYVHAGPFRNRGAADAARLELAATGRSQATVIPVEQAFAVRIGPLPTRWDAERLHALLVFRDQAAPEDVANADHEAPDRAR